MPRQGLSARADGPPAPAPLVHDPFPGPVRGVLHAVYDGAWVLGALVGSPWLAWKSLRVPGFAEMVRERMLRRLDRVPVRGERRRVLVHGVSVGEVKGAVPLVAALAEARPDLEVIVSSTTDTGLAIARESFPDHTVTRFPADLSPYVRRFLDRVDPAAVVLMELEIWPNFLRECNRRGAPISVVNGRITARSHSQYLVFRRLLPQFRRVSLVCVQNDAYAERFVDLGVDPRRVRVTGNVKVDGLRTEPVDPGEERRERLGARPGQRTIVAGSTHAPEERLLVEAWRAGAPGSRLIVVPRHPDRAADVARELTAAGHPPQRLTALRAGAERPDPDRPAIVDTIGELEGVYGLADVVFVGGSLVPHGGQNVLEPAAQGRPVVIGPSFENFRDEVALLRHADACRIVEDAHELAEAFEALLAAPERGRSMGARGRAAVLRQRGATDLTLGALEEGCLPSRAGALARASRKP